ncbi:hypothetical protein BTRA_3666 [Burkholderia thailandensis USAMRU Malaysia |nr:hypothetical protein BTQ_4170 [Burkholderia thailandensis 2002721723]AHI81616.1 hypothetical protein BTJ_5202 [Burkholderia thailandensis E444]AIC90476.1 hypothetical protein BTRA_3666 [Burkholderia thailandensis USAMRU Malaysia \
MHSKCIFMDALRSGNYLIQMNSGRWDCGGLPQVVRDANGSCVRPEPLASRVGKRRHARRDFG